MVSLPNNKTLVSLVHNAQNLVKFGWQRSLKLPINEDLCGIDIPILWRDFLCVSFDVMIGERSYLVPIWVVAPWAGLTGPSYITATSRWRAQSYPDTHTDNMKVPVTMSTALTTSYSVNSRVLQFLNRHKLYIDIGLCTLYTHQCLKNEELSPIVTQKQLPSWIRQHMT